MHAIESRLRSAHDTLQQIDHLSADRKRLRDGKDVHYLEHNVVKVIWPLEKLALIEVLESEEEENLIGFVRE